jgi:hypothetical protein
MRLSLYRWNFCRDKEKTADSTNIRLSASIFLSLRNVSVSERCEQRRKSLRAICSLGFSTTPIVNNWNTNLFKLILLNGGAMIFTVKIVCLLLMSIPWAIINFVWNLVIYFVASD